MASKYDREIQMMCPTCGGTDFEVSEESDIVKCVECGLEISRDDLLEKNQENIELHKEEIINEAKKDIEKMLKDRFKGIKGVSKK